MILRNDLVLTIVPLQCLHSKGSRCLALPRHNDSRDGLGGRCPAMGCWMGLGGLCTSIDMAAGQRCNLKILQDSEMKGKPWLCMSFSTSLAFIRVWSLGVDHVLRCYVMRTFSLKMNFGHVSP